jgi:hypothetical protein
MGFFDFFSGNTSIDTKAGDDMYKVTPQQNSALQVLERWGAYWDTVCPHPRRGEHSSVLHAADVSAANPPG